MKRALIGIVVLLGMWNSAVAQREKPAKKDPKAVELINKFMHGLNNPDFPLAVKAVIPFLHFSLLRGEAPEEGEPDERTVDPNIHDYSLKLAWQRVAKDGKYPTKFRIVKVTRAKDGKLGTRFHTELVERHYYHIKPNSKYTAKGWIGVAYKVGDKKRTPWIFTVSGL